MSGETPCRSGVRWYSGQSTGRGERAGRLVCAALLPVSFGCCRDGVVVVGPLLGVVSVSAVDVHAASSNAETAGSSNRRTGYL
jgi:hypothetical protein